MGNMRYFVTFLVGFIFQFSTHLLGIYHQVDDMITAIIPPTAQVGIIIRSVNDEQIIFEHNANKLFMPGSTLKMLTSAVALKSFGSDFTYSTQLLMDTDLNTSKGVNFYLKFSGDPSLTTQDLTDLFSSLTKAGFHHITGDIIYEDTGYAAPLINPSWMISDIHTCEMVPVSKAIIDENCYHFELLPAETVSEPAILKSKLGIQPRYAIDNTVITVCDKDYVWRSYGFISNVLRIEGKTGIKLKPQRIELPIDDLDFYIQQNIEKALENNGITLEGKIIHGDVPQNASILAEHKSATLEKIISNGLKHTLNVPFGALFLQLSPSASSWRKASETLKKAFLENYSINLGESVIDDGIGVSRYNLMSPKQLSDLLLAIYKDPTISAYFLNGLAQNGKPGTLQTRLTDQNFLNKVYAKTGSLSGISALAGYLKTNKDNLLSFVIFINGFTGSAKPYRDFQDNICRILIERL